MTDKYPQGLPKAVVVVTWIENVPRDLPQALATVELRTSAQGRFSTEGSRLALSAPPAVVIVIAHASGHRPAIVRQPPATQPIDVRLQPYDDDAEANVDAIGSAVMQLAFAWSAGASGTRPAAILFLRADWSALPAETRANAMRQWRVDDDLVAFFDFWVAEYRAARDRVYLGAPKSP